jgi:hypothetical protein
MLIFWWQICLLLKVCDPNSRFASARISFIIFCHDSGFSSAFIVQHLWLRVPEMIKAVLLFTSLPPATEVY